MEGRGWGRCGGAAPCTQPPPLATGELFGSHEPAPLLTHRSAGGCESRWARNPAPRACARGSQSTGVPSPGLHHVQGGRQAVFALVSVACGNWHGAMHAHNPSSGAPGCCTSAVWLRCAQSRPCQPAFGHANRLMNDEATAGRMPCCGPCAAEASVALKHMQQPHMPAPTFVAAAVPRNAISVAIALVEAELQAGAQSRAQHGAGHMISLATKRNASTPAPRTELQGRCGCNRTARRRQTCSCGSPQLLPLQPAAGCRQGWEAVLQDRRAVPPPAAALPAAERHAPPCPPTHRQCSRRICTWAHPPRTSPPAHTGARDPQCPRRSPAPPRPCLAGTTYPWAAPAAAAGCPAARPPPQAPARRAGGWGSSRPQCPRRTSLQSVRAHTLAGVRPRMALPSSER